MLTNAGLPPDTVSVTIQSRKIGIARDIINESEQGCCAVVIGRKGFGSLPDFMMGSIAAKLTESIAHVPLAIVGSQPEPHKVLLAFDRSREAFTMGRVPRKILSLAFNKAIWIV